MKYLFVFLTFVISLNSIAQSKKEQIAILTFRLDSLNKAYVKDTIVLGKAIRKTDGVKNVLSEQLDKTKEQLIKKSATVTEKSNTIKSLNAKNMELMQERKETQKRLNDFKLKFKEFNDSLENEMFLFSLSNGARPMNDGGQKLPVEVEVGLYINGRFYIVDNFDDSAWPSDPEREEMGDSKIYRYEKGYKEGLSIGFLPDHMGWKDIGIELIENRPYIIDTDGGGDSQTVRMRKIVFDANHNMDLIQIFNAYITFGGDGIDCISGDCDYKGYLSNKYPDDY